MDGCTYTDQGKDGWMVTDGWRYKLKPYMDR